ncbi:MAG: FAD-dependent oxidoreductase [Deltaproteobacteria bacterium]|nr:FAD-dependent oxidoreductase [Deltaproteobacteria bacterium]
MKRPKNRLQRVIIIGATPAGMAATTKLGELGIRVTLVDSEPDLDQKLSREEWRLPSGIPFNFASRPGLLRTLRNPFIRCILPAKIISMKHTAQGFSARIKPLQTYIDPDRCTSCGRCVEICPVTLPDGGKPIRIAGRTSLPGRVVIDKGPQPPCQENCPLGVNAQGYIALTCAGRFKEALDLVRRDNILPGICGRVCTHPCEDVCRRGELDAPLSIRDIKRFVADYEISSKHEPLIPNIQRREEKIAIIGSGPAGLAAAADLARFGYQVTVFEKESMAGGLLRYGIGQHRLPRAILDTELGYIERLGIAFETSHPVDLSSDLEKLKKNFDAVILTTGAWADRKLGVIGEDLDGIEGCISFLNRFYQGKIKKLEGEVAVIGDGNAAFDLARTLRRLGSNVTILSWFSEDAIPADPEEVNGAKEEGIILKDRTQVIGFSGKNGRLEHLICKPTEPGTPGADGIPWPVIIPDSKPFEIKFDQAFVAIGQTGPFLAEATYPVFSVTGNGYIEVDPSFRTNIPHVYAAGDAVTGPSTVVGAMAKGRAAALSVHRKISNENVPLEIHSRPDDIEFTEIPTDIPSVARPKMPERQPAARCKSFSEVSLGLSEVQAQFEAERCLQCGICSECLLCTEVCGSIGAINHQEQSEEIIENAGVIIVADPDAALSIKGEDVIRAYGPKVAKTEVMAMITRGFAAAANAMNLLGGSFQRPKGRGVSVPLPDPELSPLIRIGVFVCSCNDSLGWLGSMDEYVKRLTDQEDVVHAEVMPSACIPEGTANILRTIRQKSITRVVLASCVCCPLDFVCSACTDQRSRLKDALFKGSGVSRSMVETCNLRGEVLRLLKDDPLLALDRFKGFIRRAVRRARKLKVIPTPARTYNFATAVIGESESTINSAMILAEAGFEVLMFGTHDHPLTLKLDHLNIHCFEGSSVGGISGTLGDFQVFVESRGVPQMHQVGAVIIGERYERMIPYRPQEGTAGLKISFSQQKRGIPGIPSLLPGTTSMAGLFLASPSGIHVSERKKGAAAAVLAAAIMPQGPRASRGYTAVVDKNRCRGCGRCIKQCPYQAITFHRNDIGGWYAEVDEALCKGCGNCISVCPTNAADSPYRDQTNLEQMLVEVLVQ